MLSNQTLEHNFKDVNINVWAHLVIRQTQEKQFSSLGFKSTIFKIQRIRTYILMECCAHIKNTNSNQWAKLKINVTYSQLLCVKALCSDGAWMEALI